MTVVKLVEPNEQLCCINELSHRYLIDYSSLNDDNDEDFLRLRNPLKF